MEVVVMEMYVVVEGKNSAPLSTRGLVKLLKEGKAYIPFAQELSINYIAPSIVELHVVRNLGAGRDDKAGGEIVEFYDNMEERKGIYIVKWSEAETMWAGTGFERTKIPLKPLEEVVKAWKANIEELSFDEMLAKYY